MISTLKKFALFNLFVIVHFSVTAQKKELANEQYFKNDFTGIIQPLPAFSKWLDDSHFIVIKNGSRYTVDARTGAEIATVDESELSKSTDTSKKIIFIKEGNLYVKQNGKELQLTNDKEKKSNPTLSPDGNYVAYTKSNDL